VRVGAERRAALRDALERAGAIPREAKGTGEEWRYELDGATVTLWRTGTVRVQGKGEGGPLLEQLVAEVAVPDRPVPSPADALSRDRAWVGVDESGKGDYFGPLVSAAVYVEPADAERLEALGVRDSKRLTDGRVRKLAPEVRRLVKAAITTVGPERYNELYARFKREGRGLNQLLAWAHARSIEDLLEAGLDPAYAIVDQFADARVVERAVLRGTRERGLRIVQFPRAEADVAVAAASILAREEFLRRLGSLPKGAGPPVIAEARRIAVRGGRDALAEVAKLHFSTTARVLGGAEG
jgi:ribonuclease HIII